MGEIQRELKDALGSSRRSGIRFEANDADIPEVPAALAEPTVSSTAESLTTRPSARMAVATSSVNTRGRAQLGDRGLGQALTLQRQDSQRQWSSGR